MEAILYTRRLTWRKNRVVKGLTVMIVMIFAMYTEAGLRSTRSVEAIHYTRPPPQIIFQEKTVTTENDVIHVQRLLDEKEVSIVYNRGL